MKRLTAPCILILLLTSCHHNDQWIDLLDMKLTQWESYLSFSMPNNYDGEEVLDTDGKPKIPLGYNVAGQQVFTTIEENGVPILRIGSEIYGCIFTKESFRNYRFRTKIKWGDMKWVPRLEKPLDSGILYHSQGEAGVDHWRAWKLSQEFQVIEGGCGDYWSIANSNIEARAEKVSPTEGAYRYKAKADYLPFGAAKEAKDWGLRALNTDKYEQLSGEWIELELICHEGKSIHIVNGHVVMELRNSSFVDQQGALQPLVEGQIQLQCEAGEVFYKEIQIMEIESTDQIPRQYAPYFEQ